MNGTWGSGNAFSLAGCNTDNFTVYGIGYIQGPYTGTVNFCNQADDQFYLIINSTVIINDNTLKAAATGTSCNATGTMNMVAGTWYPIQAWMHEQGGGADMRLLWNYPGATTNTLIGISYYRTSAQLSTPTSVSASAAANEFSQFTVSWSAVSNVSSYRIKLYDAAGNTLLATKSGIASNSISNIFTSSDYSQLSNGTAYKVTVTAIGDGSNYEDSAESSQASVTTSIPTSSITDFALNLNGSSQYASAAGAQVIPTSTASAFTVGAWINQPASRSSEAFYQILSQGSSSNVFYAKVVNGSVRFGRTGYTGGENYCTAGVPTNEWTHVALVVGASSQSCYINGSLAGSFTQNGGNAIGTTFAVGQYAPTGGEFFLGQIDEVKIWSDARTQSEIQSDLKSYGGTLADNLVAYYDFNELVGNRVVNRSTGGSSAFDLTTANAPTIASTSIIETSTVQAYTVVKFMRTFLVAGGGWTAPANRRLNVLAVGGGGAGGGGIGGGGGAGEFVESNTLITATTIIPVFVGSGGTPREWLGGNAGQNSSFSSIIAYGGGGGGTNEANGPTASQGPNLGSQGGGGYPNTVYTGSNPAPLIAIASASDSIRFRNNGGAGSGGSGSTATGGGGGGAGGVGAPGTTTNAGNGGAGKSSAITGSTVFYAAGGGAGVNGASSPGFPASIANGDPGVGGSGIGGNGGQEANSNPGDQYGNRGDGSSGTVNSRGTAGNANTGSGGGGASNWTVGGSGGSGVVVIRYITNLPTILTQPLSDTTTAGIVETFTVTTSAAPAPLTKSVQWQFTTDTATGVTGWANVSSGTGSTTDTFTTLALTTSMNKYRYRVIITFSDTSTLSVQETSTVAILTINPAITISSDTSTITRKYGDTQTVRTIVYSGGTTSTGAVGISTSHAVHGQVGNLANGRITVDTATTTAYFKVDTGTAVGTYVETVTVTDFKGATASYSQRVIVTVADTLTVQADTLTAITFGGTLNPTVTVTGLKNGDSVATATFSRVSCANGGLCAVGDIGPGGGVVFHLITNMSDSQTAIAGYTSGGIYLEAAPVGWGNGIPVGAGETTGTSYLDPVVSWCNTTGNTGATEVGIGQGGKNTRLGDIGCTSGAVQIATDLILGGKNDWYLPSQNELEQMGLQKNLIGLIYGQTNCYETTCYWSSSEVGGGSSSRALQVNVGSNVMGSNDKLLTASNQVMMRPIRAFSPITNNTETVTAGAPTAAGTYTLRPTAITLANGVNTNNYVAILYRSSPVTINRAAESPRISMQEAKVAYDTGTVTQVLTATSGVGTGAIFYMIGAGSAAGCSISGSTVRSTSAGVCNVIAFKQASTNYLADSATAVAITFTRFVATPLPVPQSPTTISLPQGNALETSTLSSSTLTISAATRTGAGAHTITGTGFTNIDLVTIGGASLSGSNYTRVSDTTLNLSGVEAFMGPLLIRLADSQESVLFQIDWS